MNTSFPDYQPPNPLLWQGRRDSLAEERFFQQVRCLSIVEKDLPKEKHLIFLGFASDTGIIRNEGRPGAKCGPDQLRGQLAKLPLHKQGKFLDIGNITCENGDLETSQNQLAKLIQACHDKGHSTIAFGGGHEIAWPHFKGLSAHYPKIGIINFDAHFDLRPLSREKLGTSGTPFSQIAAYCQTKELPFSYCCIGIQSQGNTQSLFQRAKELQVTYLSAEEMHQLSFEKQADFLDNFIKQHNYIYLSICLDVFSECYAPGVSAPQALGISPWQALPLLKNIMQTGKVISLDIAELSPPLDYDGKTARLAAGLIAKLVEYSSILV